MTVFKATQAVNLNAASFGTIFSIFVGSPVFEVHTGAELEVRNIASTIEIDLHSALNHPFVYLSNVPVGGNIGSIQVNEPAGTLAYKFSGMSVPITSLAADVNSGHYAAALNLIFGGNDT